MSVSLRLVVFDALMLRALIANDDEMFHAELAAFRVAFQGRSFTILLTDGILSQYQVESMKVPQFLPQPIVNRLRRQGRATYLEEHLLNRIPMQLTGLPNEHQEFIRDAVAGRASYLVTNRPPWLALSPQIMNYGLQIVNPSRFAEL